MGALSEGIAARLETTAATYVKERRLPGAMVGAVHDGALVWSSGIGFADVASRRAPEASTLYRVASITKTVTGTAIMRLRDEGKLRLDDGIGLHIPELVHLEDVTIRRLLSHESGLQSEPPGTDWRKARYEADVARNLARASEIRTTVPPNTQEKYSNLGYQLLGEVVTRVSGIPYAQYVTTEIFQPLGMTGSAFEPLAPDLRQRCATGYSGRFVSDELTPSPAAPSIGSEGGLWSCLDDLARWIAYQLTDEPTLREMHRPRYLGNEDWTEAFGISWYAVRRQDVIWIQHSGALHGFRSSVCFDRKHKVGAIALLNGIGSASELSMSLAEIVRVAVAAMPPRVEAPMPLPEGYGELIGLYFDPDLGEIRRVEWRDGKLAILNPDDPAWRPTLTATSDRDVFTVDPGERESGENVIFNRAPDGRVASVFIAAGTWRRLDPVTVEEVATQKP